MSLLDPFAFTLDPLIGLAVRVLYPLGEEIDRKELTNG